MKSSQVQSLHSEDIISIPAANRKALLTPEETAWIDGFYLQTLSEYKSLVEEYEKEKHRNRRLKFFHIFPSRENWEPLTRKLLPSEYKLLCGPAPNITVLKRVQLRDHSTGRIIL